MRLGWILRRLEALQQEGRVDDEGETESHQGVHEDVELRLPEAALPQPLEYVRLGAYVASEDARETPPEIHDSRQVSDAPFPRVTRIGHLDERYVEVVRFAVDPLEFLHDGFALFGFWFVWKVIVG